MFEIFVEKLNSICDKFFIKPISFLFLSFVYLLSFYNTIHTCAGQRCTKGSSLTFWKNPVFEKTQGKTRVFLKTRFIPGFFQRSGFFYQPWEYAVMLQDMSLIFDEGNATIKRLPIRWSEVCEGILPIGHQLRRGPPRFSDIWQLSILLRLHWLLPVKKRNFLGPAILLHWALFKASIEGKKNLRLWRVLEVADWGLGSWFWFG